MGTRGLYGFVINGETKATYNHYDSYPSALGNEIKKFISENSIEEIRKAAERIRAIDRNSEPTSDDVIRYGKYYNESVNNGSVKDYYALLRELQGDLQSYIDDPELDIMIDDKDFILDSLFFEWGYLINLDSGMLEIYRGFQKTPPKNNRYGKKVSSITKIEYPDYYPCEMIKEIPLEQVKDFDMNKLEGDDDES